jgi:hypothetical protein
MEELRRARDAAEGADLVEVRLDGVDRPDAAAALDGRLRPTIVTCRPRWEGGQFDGSEEERRQILDAASAAGEASRQIAAKVDWIAGYEALGPESYKALVGAGRRAGVRVSGRPGASSMGDLAAAGVSSIETLAFPLKAAAAPADDAWPAAGARELAGLQARLVRGRVTLVPMMAAAMARAFPEEAADDPALALLPAARRAALKAALAKLPAADVAKAKRAWTSQAAFLKRFVAARGRVAAGTGFELAGYPVPGVGLHRELSALVRAGLSPIEAIRAATSTAADLVGAKPAVVRFTPGTDANFIIVSGDPLKKIEDLAKITHVVRAGEVLDPKVLLARAQQALAPRGLKTPGST